MKNKENNYVIDVMHIIAFICIGVLLIYEVLPLLKRKDFDEWHRTEMTKVYANKDKYDILYVGTSRIIANVSNQEMFDQYGLACITLGEPEQPTYLSYYSLKEALNYQTPSVVIFDTASLFYSEESLREKIMNAEFYDVHYTTDNIRSRNIKAEVAEVSQHIMTAKDAVSGEDYELKKIDKWDYLSDIYYLHRNWENITEKNFKPEEQRNEMLGSLMLFNMDERLSNVDISQKAEWTDEVADIPEINKEYFIKIIELCQSKNIPLIVISGKVRNSWKWDEYNAVHNITEEYNIPYLDVNLCDEEMGMNWQLDTSDISHFNMVGAKKWTDYIGAYITEHYDYVDHRGDERYKEFTLREEEYQRNLSAMYTKQELIKALDFREYLSTLADIDLEDNVILVSVKDSAFKYFGETEQELFNEIGLMEPFVGAFGSSYAAVITQDGVREDLGEINARLEGNLDDGTTYLVTSGGKESDLAASIKLNDAENIADGRGFNITVYNRAISSVISTVSFDTYDMENPPRLRGKTKEEKYSEYESAPNVWSVFNREEYINNRGY